MHQFLQRWGPLLIIYNCTSMLYHRPIATVSMMLANVFAFAWSSSATDQKVIDYSLWYGNGLHPIQWLTCNFLHADSSHLLGNLFFLWPFGMLVEGKLGWWKFVLLYLAIAVGQGALQQTVMLGADSTATSTIMHELENDPQFTGLSEEEKQLFATLITVETGEQIRRGLGASSVIFGLLAVCMIWAPASDFSVWWRFGTFEAPVLMVGAFYVMLECFTWFNNGFRLSSAALHLAGVVAGLSLGLLWLKLKIPETDGDDIFGYVANGSTKKSIPRAQKSKTKKAPIAAEGTRLERAKAMAAEKLEQQREKKKQESALIEHGKTSSRSDRSTRGQTPEPTDTIAGSRRDASSQAFQITDAIASEQLAVAVKLLRATEDPRTLAQVSSKHYQAVYRQAAGAKQWNGAIVVLQKWLTAIPSSPDSRRLQIAQILVSAMQKPANAQRILGKIDPAKLTHSQAQLFDRLTTKVKASLSKE